MHDYLAEEVVGRLPKELQMFLMRASLLEAVTPESVSTVVDAHPGQVIELLNQSEHLGLLSRRDGDSERYRFHPLVMDFLQARAKTELGPKEVQLVHHRAAV